MSLSHLVLFSDFPLPQTKVKAVNELQGHGLSCSCIISTVSFHYFLLHASSSGYYGLHLITHPIFLFVYHRGFAHAVLFAQNTLPTPVKYLCFRFQPSVKYFRKVLLTHSQGYILSPGFFKGKLLNKEKDKPDEIPESILDFLDQNIKEWVPVIHIF